MQASSTAKKRNWIKLMSQKPLPPSTAFKKQRSKSSLLRRISPQEQDEDADTCSPREDAADSKDGSESEFQDGDTALQLLHPNLLNSTDEIAFSTHEEKVTEDAGHDAKSRIDDSSATSANGQLTAVSTNDSKDDANDEEEKEDEDDDNDQDKVIARVIGLFPFKGHVIAMVEWEGDPDKRAFLDAREVRRRNPDIWMDYLESLVTFPRSRSKKTSDRSHE